MPRQTTRFRSLTTRAVFASLLLFFVWLPALAQLPKGISGIKSGARPEETEVIFVKASIIPSEKADTAKLAIDVDLKDGWHTYSITQKPGGPYKTSIKLDENTQFKLTGEFQPDPAPEKHIYKDAWPDLEVEEHHKHVTWTAPIQLTQGGTLEKLSISGAVRAQICSDACLAPKDYKFTALPAKKAAAVEPAGTPIEPATSSFADDAGLPDLLSLPGLPPVDVPGQYRPLGAHLAIVGVIEPAVAPPGSVAKLKITATPDASFHVYPYLERFGGDLGAPTLIVLAQTSNLRSKSPVSNVKPVVKELTGGGTMSYHADPVTWTIDFEIPADLKPGDYPINGLIGIHSCSDKSCDEPQGARFDGKIAVGNRSSEGGSPLQFTTATYKQAMDLAKQSDEAKHGAAAIQPLPPLSAQPPGTAPTAHDPKAAALPAETTVAAPVFDESKLRESSKQNRSFAWVMLYGLAGGLLLNLMPCVLPVIGLKVLSFVDQSQHDRNRAFMLNVWYTIGSLAVFMTLAIVAIVLRTAAEKLTLGKQFGDPRFVIPMASILFVMALSMIGVWEIPIPGFLGDRKANSLQSKEGAAGAFFKGIITTCLATPCAGPGIALALAYAADPNTPVIGGLLAFLAIGIGMNSPYLIIGANPKLVRFLPKPGMWMETFKQAMGFVLLGTVVYLMFVIDITYVLPIFSLLMGLWAACWAIGRLPITASASKKNLTWLGAITFAALIGAFSLTWLHREAVNQVTTLQQDAVAAAVPDRTNTQQAVANSSELPWRDFSNSLLKSELAAGKTVMIDFTAKWCFNCRVLENTVLNTPEIKSVVDQHNITTLRASIDVSADSDQMLHLLDNDAVPVLAIFTPEAPNNPAILRNLYTKQVLLDTLKSVTPTKVGMLDP